MSDAFETYQDRIATHREKVKYVASAVGVAVAIGDRVVSVDFFDKPATGEKVWSRLLPCTEVYRQRLCEPFSVLRVLMIRRVLRDFWTHFGAETWLPSHHSPRFTQNRFGESGT